MTTINYYSAKLKGVQNENIMEYHIAQALLMVQISSESGINIIRGDATGAAGTATAIPNLNQISSGSERFFYFVGQ